MNVDELLDPETAEVLATIPGLGALSDELLPRIRAQRVKLAAAAQSTLSDQVVRTDHLIAGLNGAPDVTVRLHRPVGGDVDSGGDVDPGGEGPLPCLYWMHGGGFVIGTHLGDDAMFDAWCHAYRCVGVSVEYRLAPETPYPGPMDDAYAGLAWVHANAAELGVDPTRIGIGGASAGAGLAAGLGLRARDAGQIPLAFQLLIYPMLDDRMVNQSATWEVPVWPPSSNAFGWRAYLGDAFGGDVATYAAPARAENLAGLPPTYIMVGSLDGFLDEDIDYARRLNGAGVPCELHVHPGAPHGFQTFAPNTALARRATALTEDWLRRALAGA